MSEFARQVYRAVGEYRSILRRNMSQAERMMKLQALNLKVKLDQTTDLEFFNIAKNIVKDVFGSRNENNVSYYSYHGSVRFADHLKRFLDDYAVQNGRVVHKGQLASRAYLDAVQMLSLPEEKWTDTLARKMAHALDLIAKYGSEDEVKHCYSLLKHEKQAKPQTFAKLLFHYQQALKDADRLLFDISKEQVA